MLLWPLRVLSRVFLVHMMSDQDKQSRSLHFISYTIPLEASFSILSFGFLSMFERVKIHVGFSEKVAKVLRGFNIKVAHKPTFRVIKNTLESYTLVTL